MLKSSDHKPKVSDWQSVQDQREWFNKFKIVNADGLEGLDLKQFQEFLSCSLYPHLMTKVIYQASPTQQQQAGGVKLFSSDQELKLFNYFDLKNDKILDQDEFSLLCQNWLDKIFQTKSALVIVDVQNDFIDGSLALLKSPASQDGAEVVPVINKLLDEGHFDVVVYTQDWHPSNHIGFHDNLHLRKYTQKLSDTNNDAQVDGIEERSVISGGENQGATTAIEKCKSTSCKLSKLSTKAKLFDTVLFDEGRMEQILWPRHCVQGSWGAELHPKLKVIQNSIRILKGTLSHVDAYSAFWDNLRLNETNLRDELTSRGVTDVFFCGLAYDYCVAASALDSRKAGFMTYVIEDACRGINNDSIKKMTSNMLENDILIIDTRSACGYLASARDHVKIDESSQLTRNGNGDGHNIHTEIATEDDDNYKMRSDELRSLLVATSFTKAFLRNSV